MYKKIHLYKKIQFLSDNYDPSFLFLGNFNRGPLFANIPLNFGFFAAYSKRDPPSYYLGINRSTLEIFRSTGARYRPR